MSEPKFIQADVNHGGISAAANTAADGSGTLAVIASADSEAGLRIDAINFVASATTVAGLLRVYLFRPGEAARTIKEIPVTATTGSTTAKAWSFDWVPSPAITLEKDCSLRFAHTVGTAKFCATVVSGGAL
jgi:hypothetical protein